MDHSINKETNHIESFLIRLEDLHPDDQECISQMARKCAIAPEKAMIFYSYGFYMCELLTAYQMKQEMNKKTIEINRSLLFSDD